MKAVKLEIGVARQEETVRRSVFTNMRYSRVKFYAQYQIVAFVK